MIDCYQPREPEIHFTEVYELLTELKGAQFILTIFETENRKMAATLYTLTKFGLSESQITVYYENADGKVFDTTIGQLALWQYRGELAFIDRGYPLVEALSNYQLLE